MYCFTYLNVHEVVSISYTLSNTHFQGGVIIRVLKTKSRSTFCTITLKNVSFVTVIGKIPLKVTFEIYSVLDQICDLFFIVYT